MRERAEPPFEVAPVVLPLPALFGEKLVERQLPRRAQRSLREGLLLAEEALERLRFVLAARLQVGGDVRHVSVFFTTVSGTRSSVRCG